MLKKEQSFVVQSTGPQGGEYLDLVRAENPWQAQNRLKLFLPNRNIVTVFTAVNSFYKGDNTT